MTEDLKVSATVGVNEFLTFYFEVAVSLTENADLCCRAPLKWRFFRQSKHVSPAGLSGYRPPVCEHRLTLYILPSLLQVAAFLYGFYMFRIIGVDEELYAIMERASRATGLTGHHCSSYIMFAADRMASAASSMCSKHVFMFRTRLKATFA